MERGIGGFRDIPGDVREWNRFFRQVRVAPSEGTVVTDTIVDGSVTDAKLRDSAPTSVIGRAAGTTGSPADIAAGGDDEFLVSRGGALIFGTLVETDIPPEIARDTEIAAAVAAALLALGVSSGVYTPALTNVANLDGSTAFECQYLRVGTTVHVAGKVSVNPTAGGAATRLGIALPVASDFGAEEDCAGAAFASGIAGQGAAIRGDAANNRAELIFIAADLTDQPMYFSFSYQVLP